MSTDALRLGPPTIELKASGDAGMIEGYASTFNGPPDAYGDVVAAGAFASSLIQHKGRGTMPSMLWSHDGSQPIGAWTSASEDSRGLAVRGQLTLAVERASEALALAKAGALGLSIGFRTKKADRDPAGHRRLLAVELIETSLVAIPANHAARITSIKSALPPAEEVRTSRAFEELLRSLGFARSLAAGIAAKGWAAAARRGEPEPEAVAELVRAIERRAATLHR